MASPNFYNPGGASGARLATRNPIAMSGRIWYVSASGTDAGGSRGLARTNPLRTTAQAITNAVAGDTIQFLEGFTETVATTVAVNKAGLHFISEGTEATRARFTLSAVTTAFTVSVAGVYMENLTFLEPTAAGATALVGLATTTSAFQAVNCQFNCGNTLLAGISVPNAANNIKLNTCTFTSTATSTALRPGAAILTAAAVTDMEMLNVTCDGGTYGWTNIGVNFGASVTRLVAIDLDLLNDSDMIVATGSVYKIHRRNTSGSAYMELTA